MKTTNTIKNFAMRFAAVIAAVLLAGNAWGTNAVYTVTSTSAVSASNAPANSSSSYANTYTTTYQTSANNTATLTLTGLGGISISNITLSMHSNSGNGTGMLSYSTDGGSNWTYLVGSSDSGVTFNNSAWNGSYTTSWVNISKDVNLSNVTQLKVRIEVTYKSLYCQSFTISYSAGCSTKLTITKAGQTNGTFSLHAGAANGSELTGTGKNEIGNCSSQTVYVVPSPATGYVASACTATNKTSGPTASGSNWYIVYPSSNSNTSSTVTVTFSGKQCALVFNQNNGTGGQSSNLTATYGSAMPTISGIPTRDHYNFLGYYDGTGNTATQYYTSTGASARNWDKNTTSNTTLYARWEEKGIARYVTNCCTPLGAIGGSVALTQSGSDIVVDGWNATTGGNENGYLVRLYNSDKSNVISYANTGSKDTKSHTFTNPGAGTYWVSVSPTYTGDGNYCDAGDETFSAESITLTGKVNITFKKNGATGTDDQVQAVDYDTETALEDVSERGYTAPGCKEFGGWASSEDNAAAGTVAYANGANITATEPVVLWAIWNTKTFAISDGTIGASVASHSFSVNTIDCGETLTITCAPTNAYKGNPTVTATGTHGTITVVSATEVTIANVQSSIAVSIAYETAKENYEVTWNVNGAETKKSFVEGTTFATIMADLSKPDVADEAVSANCDANKFMGWATAPISKDNATNSDVSWYDGEATLSGKQTFYAVWAKKSTSQGDLKPILNEPFTNLSNCPAGPGSAATTLKDSEMSYACYPNNTSSNTRIMTSGGPTGGSEGNNIIIQKNNGYFRIDDIPTDGQTSLTLKYRETGSGTLSVTSTTTGVTVGNPTEDGTLYTHTISIPANTEKFVLKFTNTHSSSNLRIDDINISYTPSVTTYSNYITECCVPLTTVDGNISIGNIAEGGARATWSWSGATTGISKNVLKVYNTSDVCVKTIDNISASATQQDITGLTPCTEYYVTLTTVKSSGYCDGEEQGKSDNFTTNPWAVHYSGGDETEGALLSNVTKLSGGEGACTNANYVATFQADAGYLLPNSIIVYIAGIEVTAGVDYTWAVSEGIGTLTIFTSELSEEIDVRIIGVERPSYTVAIVNPAHGTITVMNGESSVSSGSNVKGGSVLTLSGTGNTAAYRVVDFSAYKTGEPGTAVAISTNTLTMPEYAITITAGEEELIPAYIAVAEGQSTWGTAQIGVYGSVEPGAGPVYIDDQEELLLVATPNEGYAFVNWTADGTASYNNAQDATTTAMIGESRTFTANFQPIVATPTFTSATGTYYDNATVELSCATADATIRYTLDGSEPTSTSDAYSTQFAVSSTTTIKAKAFKAGCKESATASVTYTIGYTVKWSVNGNDAYSAGVTDANSKVASGGSVSVPTAPADNTISGCANKFMGWSAKNLGFEEGKGASDYNDLFTETSPAINGPAIFYAVFATAEDEKHWEMGTITTVNGGNMSYANCNGEHTVTGSDGNEYTYTSNDVQYSGGNQFKASTGKIYNTTSLGRITKIVLDGSTANTNQIKVYESNTMISEKGTLTALTGTMTDTYGYDYEYTMGGKGFFLVAQEGSNAPKVNVKVYFGEAPINYVTMCDNTKAKVTYDLNGGEGGCATDKYTKEGFKTCATEPTKTGYDFAGWNDGTSTYDANADYTLTDDITFTAQWTAKNYTIVYVVNGGTAKDNESYTIEAAYELTPATKGHEQFVGWHVDPELNDEVVTTIPAGQTGTKTFYAEWAPRYEITFVNDGVTVGSIWRAANENLDAEVAGEDAIPALNAPSSCSSKVFVGWLEAEIEADAVAEAPEGLRTSNAFAVSENKTFYAVWATKNNVEQPVPVFEDDMSTYAARATNADAFAGSTRWSGNKAWGTNATSTNNSGVRLSSSTGDGYADLDLRDKELATSFTIQFDLKRYDNGATVTISTFDDGCAATFSPAEFTAGENWATQTCTVTNTDQDLETINFGASGRLNIKNVVITQQGIVTTYNEYSTSCCTKGEIIGASKEGVALSGGTLTSTYNRCCAGREVVLTATVNDGYIFNSWVVKAGDNDVDGTSDTDGSGNPRFTFTMPDGNVNVSANFAIDATDYIVETNDELVIDAPTVMANLTVEAGGELNIETGGSLTVNNLTIESTSGSSAAAGTSGEVIGTNMTINGDMFLTIQLRSDAMDADASSQWYCISAPFDVAINGGFYWGDGTPMVLNTHFQLFEWDGDRRATGASGWRRTSSDMQAGVAYFIGFDNERSNQNTIKLKAKSKTITNTTSITLPTHNSSVDDKYSNWNGMGNPNFHHVAFSEDIQAFDYNVQTYNTYETGSYNFVVGTPFFVKDLTSIDIEEANNAQYRAPKREIENRYSYGVRITTEGAQGFDNQMYVRASEDASSEYEIGHDLPTLNGTSSNYGALLWTENYGGKHLAIEEAPLVNGTASYVLTLSAPKAGTYSISVAAPQDNADLYLTYDGTIIWNLSESAYTVDLNKGITNGYGLVLRAKAPSVVTGVDQINAKAGAQKVIIDEHVYILRGGQMYDVNGKMVK